MKKWKILVTGHRGMLGTDLMKVLSKRFSPVGLDLPEFDITKRESTIKACLEIKPDLVIHTAAFTDVDGCERFPEKAFAVNALGTAHLAEACAQLKVPLVYISTDFVFDGKKTSPYLEFDSPNPLQTYGRSKLAGEFYTKHLLTRFFIIRTAWLYGSGSERNFVSAILKKAKGSKKIEVVDDQTGSPTLTEDLCVSIMEILKNGGYGLYHAVNRGVTSWYEFAKTILRISGKNVSVQPISSEALHRAAKRPANSALQNFVLETVLGLKMPTWQEAIRRYLKNR